MSNLRQVTEGLPERVFPLQTGGVVDGAYPTQDQVIRNITLEGRSFLSRCSIPDIQPQTKILAVCGTNDYNSSRDNKKPGLASPVKDGWFLSDFYLFHHLLQGIASDQVWLTCLRPKYLVGRYGEYLHGDSNSGSRRVVLDRNMLGETEDVLYVPENELLSRFLSTLREICHDAANESRPTLVLIFGHGDSASYSIAIGGTTTPPNAPQLTLKLFKEALGLRPKPKLCLLTTACFSGGWAINPNLKITSMAAQAYWGETLAWPVSGTANRRSCGSPYASAVAKALLNLTLEDFGGEDHDDYNQLPTYAGFTKVVSDTLHQLDPRQVSFENQPGGYSVHQPMFSALNDEWEIEYTKRTGLPLNVFQARWLALREAAARPPPPGGEHRSAPGERAYSYEQLSTIVTRQSETYMASYPGMDNKAKNISLHNTICTLLEDPDTLDIDELANLQNELDYRLNQIMAAATTYKRYLEVEMTDCQKLNMDTHPAHGDQNWGNVLTLVRKYPLFDRPTGGHAYTKGDEYMAACILKAGWSMEQATAKLEGLVKYKGRNKSVSGVSNVEGTSRVMYTIQSGRLQHNSTIRETLRRFAQQSQKRLRSLSPDKSRRRRATLPSEWTHGDEGSEGSGGTLEVGNLNFAGPSR